MKHTLLAFIAIALTTHIFAAPRQSESADKVAKSIAKNFNNSYSMDGYVSGMKAFKTIRSKEGYIDFKAAVGLAGFEARRSKAYFKSPMFAVTDRFASFSYQSDAKNILTEENITGSYPLGYRNDFAVWELRNIGDILDFSPLNPVYAALYNYEYDPNDPTRIYFKSDNISHSLNRLPVVASGYIIYNAELMQIERVIFDDYSSYRYVKIIQPKAYEITITIDFTTYNNKLIISEIAFNRIWNKKGMDRSYDTYPPNRRDPVGNEIAEYFLMIIDPPLEEYRSFMQTSARLNNMGASDNRLAWWVMSYECAPYNPERWPQSFFLEYSSEEMPVNEIFRDLSKYTPIYQQVDRFINYSPAIKEYVILRDRYGLGIDLSDYQSFLKFYNSVYDIFDKFD